MSSLKSIQISLSANILAKQSVYVGCGSATRDASERPESHHLEGVAEFSRPRKSRPTARPDDRPIFSTDTGNVGMVMHMKRGALLGQFGTFSAQRS